MHGASRWLLFKDITMKKLFKEMRGSTVQIIERTGVSVLLLHLTWCVSTCPNGGKSHYKSVHSYSDSWALSDDFGLTSVFISKAKKSYAICYPAWILVKDFREFSIIETATEWISCGFVESMPWPHTLLNDVMLLFFPQRLITCLYLTCKIIPLWNLVFLLDGI